MPPRVRCDHDSGRGTEQAVRRCAVSMGNGLPGVGALEGDGVEFRRGPVTVTLPPCPKMLVEREPAPARPWRCRRSGRSCPAAAGSGCESVKVPPVGTPVTCTIWTPS